MTNEQIAKKFAAALTAAGYSARVSDEGGDEYRVYVSRQLSKGRQDMGYIEIDDEGDANFNTLSRAKATIRDLATAAIA